MSSRMLTTTFLLRHLKAMRWLTPLIVAHLSDSGYTPLYKKGLTPDAWGPFFISVQAFAPLLFFLDDSQINPILIYA